MKLFQSESEPDNMEQEYIVYEQFESFAQTVETLRHRIDQRQTLLKNAEKKLQEFQDSIYAMLIEESAPKKIILPKKGADDAEALDFAEGEESVDLFELLGDDEEEEA